jgi:hypothetical protein
MAGLDPAIHVFQAISIDPAEKVLYRFIDPHNPLQRAWRDTHAVAQHIGLVGDIQAINYGAVRLGLECPDKRV